MDNVLQLPDLQCSPPTSDGKVRQMSRDGTLQCITQSLHFPEICISVYQDL